MKPAVEVSITSWKKNVVKPGQEYGRVLLMPGTGYNCDRPLLYWSAQALVEAGWRIDRMNVRNASDDLSTVIPVLNQAIDGWVAAARESGAGKAGDSGDGVAADDSATVLADGAAGSPNRDSDTPSGPRLLLIGKSLTTMTYPHVASHYGLPFVLLTPVLHHADFDPSARVIPVPAVGDDIVAESEAPSVAEARAIIRAELADQSHAASSRYSGPAPLICAGTADPFYDRARANALTPHVHEYPDANHSIEVPGHWRRSLDYLKEVTASIKKSGFDGIIVNISNPADVITHYIQHMLNWAPERIFSTSTTLDSARLRRAIAQETGIDQKSITAYALGEHGESQMVAWSAVTIAGKPLSQWRDEYPDTFGKLDLDALADAGREGGWTILRGKGCTEFGIGASAAEVVRAIFYNENRVLSVSVLLDGQYGQHDVYASVPAIVGRDGIAHIIELHLTPEEQEKFDVSCRTMSANYQLSLTL